MYCRNHISCENFKLKFCTCVQSIALGHTYKVSTWNSHNKCDFWYCVFLRDHFRGLRNVSETTPVHLRTRRCQRLRCHGMLPESHGFSEVFLFNFIDISYVVNSFDSQLMAIPSTHFVLTVTSAHRKFVVESKDQAGAACSAVTRGSRPGSDH